MKLNNNQKKWQELIYDNNYILILADRGSGKTCAMRSLQGNIVMVVKNDHEKRKYDCDKTKKTIIFHSNYLHGYHPDIIIFDDVDINDDNFEDFKNVCFMYQSKICVIGTHVYDKVVNMFKEIGIVYSNDESYTKV